MFLVLSVSRLRFVARGVGGFSQNSALLLLLRFSPMGNLAICINPTSIHIWNTCRRDVFRSSTNIELNLLVGFLEAARLDQAHSLL
jgi:hypothetical protein